MFLPYLLLSCLFCKVLAQDLEEPFYVEAYERLQSDVLTREKRFILPTPSSCLRCCLKTSRCPCPYVCRLVKDFVIDLIDEMID
ncbi:hypothetical protein L596_029487 [Steinernema carpocapsae]|uniref:Uncharacterized protein n=1 Tax=Steinernema carpocapsae TaxID=34508 RepID=A0A4U5LUT5_STECR|nr:hypothetical protein L596_029487 [Steinernema carpocapsae]